MVSSSTPSSGIRTAVDGPVAGSEQARSSMYSPPSGIRMTHSPSWTGQTAKRSWNTPSFT
eukprot:8385719-Alexandrium_andersonii.AAC.1